MSHTYTAIGSGSYVGAYTMPDDGDSRNAAAFNVPMEGMAEDVRRVKGLVDSGTANFSAVKHFPFTHIPSPSSASDFTRTFNIFSSQMYWVHNAHTVVKYLEAPLDLPEGFEISQIQAWIDPKTGRGGLPLTKPTIFLLQQNNQTGASANLGSATDSSATREAYETHHAITLNLSPVHVVGRSQWSYSVFLTTESSTNAQSNGLIYSVKVTGTVKRVF